jgi:hypothetical protein
MQTQFQVFDGSLESLCGCQGVRAQVVSANSSSLTCVVPVGTTLFISYAGATLRHQIVPTGMPTFVPSTLYDPSDSLPITSFAVQFTTAGTYGFEDIYNSGVRGQIVVQ